jgi:hypothetical protein
LQRAGGRLVLVEPKTALSRRVVAEVERAAMDAAAKAIFE